MFYVLNDTNHIAFAEKLLPVQIRTDSQQRGIAMQKNSSIQRLTVAMACAGLCHFSMAHDGTHTGGIQSAPTTKVQAPFDIFHTRITTEGNVATFHIAVSGKAGASKPTKSGKLAGSKVFSYVWPTTMGSPQKTENKAR